MHRTGGEEPRQRVLGNVVVVAVESAGRDALLLGERVQLGQIRVADEMRPQPAVRGPDGVVDENGPVAILGRGHTSGLALRHRR